MALVSQDNGRVILGRFVASVIESVDSVGPRRPPPRGPGRARVADCGHRRSYRPRQL